MQADSKTLLIAIRAHCLDCCGGSRMEVERCRLDGCSLHPYRTVGVVAEERHRPEVLAGQISIFGEVNNGSRLSKGA